jgi:hypothetical protein
MKLLIFIFPGKNRINNNSSNNNASLLRTQHENFGANFLFYFCTHRRRRRLTEPNEDRRSFLQLQSRRGLAAFQIFIQITTNRTFLLLSESLRELAKSSKSKSTTNELFFFPLGRNTKPRSVLCIVCKVCRLTHIENDNDSSSKRR